MYVEAYKEAHVKEAIRGLRNFFPSKGVKLVPLKEMVDAITVNRKAKAAMRESSSRHHRIIVFNQPGIWLHNQHGVQIQSMRADFFFTSKRQCQILDGNTGVILSLLL